MRSSLDQFVLIKASKSLGGVWSDDDYIVRDRAHNVVVGRNSHHPFTITGMQRHANRRWRILRRDGWRVSTNLCPLFDDLLLLESADGLRPRQRSMLAFANVPPN
jgi:hypothetical protein